MKIAAKEIDRQADRVYKQLHKYKEQSKKYVQDLDLIQNVIAGEDSEELYKQLGYLKDKINEIEEDMNTNFTKLTEQMSTYVSKTLWNEESTKEEIAEVNNKLENIRSRLNSVR